RSYVTLGVLYANNMRQLKKADEAYQQALQLFEKLVQEHPDVLEFTYDVGHCYCNLAENALQVGRLDAALSNDQKAIEILESVVSKGYERARVHLLQARIHRTSIRACQGDHGGATDDANALAGQEGLTYANIYNIACVFALSSAAVEKDSKLAPADRTR